jgi:hypothetical protein
VDGAANRPRLPRRLNESPGLTTVSQLATMISMEQLLE